MAKVDTSALDVVVINHEGEVCAAFRSLALAMRFAQDRSNVLDGLNYTVIDADNGKAFAGYLNGKSY